MSDAECYTHTRRYFDLSTHPLAHIEFRYIPIFYDKTKNPYEFDLWEADTEELENRIDAITNVHLRK